MEAQNMIIVHVVNNILWIQGQPLACLIDLICGHFLDQFYLSVVLLTSIQSSAYGLSGTRTTSM